MDIMELSARHTKTRSNTLLSKHAIQLFYQLPTGIVMRKPYSEGGNWMQVRLSMILRGMPAIQSMMQGYLQSGDAKNWEILSIRTIEIIWRGSARSMMTVPSC